MKFHQLAIGQTFIWREERYRKTTPLLSTHLESGRPRMLMRSAEVRLACEQDEASDETQVHIDTLPRVLVESGLEHFEREALALFSSYLPNAEAGKIDMLRTELQRLRREQLASLCAHASSG